MAGQKSSSLVFARVLGFGFVLGTHGFGTGFEKLKCDGKQAQNTRKVETPISYRMDENWSSNWIAKMVENMIPVENAHPYRGEIKLRAVSNCEVLLPKMFRENKLLARCVSVL